MWPLVFCDLWCLLLQPWTGKGLQTRTTVEKLSGDIRARACKHRIGYIISLWQVQKKYIRYIYKNNGYLCSSVLYSTRVIGFSLRYLKKKYPVTWDPLTPELAQPFRLRVTTIHLSFTLIHLFISNTYIDWHYTCGLPWIVLDIPKGLLWCRCRKLFRRLSRHHESAFEKALHWSSNRAWLWYR